jgi:hypothetical protein
MDNRGLTVRLSQRRRVEWSQTSRAKLFARGTVADRRLGRETSLRHGDTRRWGKRLLRHHSRGDSRIDCRHSSHTSLQRGKRDVNRLSYLLCRLRVPADIDVVIVEGSQRRLRYSLRLGLRMSSHDRKVRNRQSRGLDNSIGSRYLRHSGSSTSLRGKSLGGVFHDLSLGTSLP